MLKNCKKILNSNNKSIIPSNSVLFKKYKFSKLYKTKNNYMIKQTKFCEHNKESEILGKLNNNTVIKIYDKYSDEKNNYILMDYYKNGDLHYNIYTNQIQFDRNSMNKKFLRNLINPIIYIHNMNIVHLDLKLENYLVDNNNNFVLCDFHKSKYHTVPYDTKCELDSIVGTKYFIAPEINEKYFTKKSDIYSLGCILYSLYAKTHYRGDIKYGLLKNIPSKMTSLISDTLRVNPNERPTIYDIKNNYSLK